MKNIKILMKQDPLNMGWINLQSEDYENLRYIFSAKLRVQILLKLYNQSMSLNELIESFNVNNTNMLHHLKELNDLNLIDKHEKIYSLTQTGFVTSQKIDFTLRSSYSLKKHNKFFSEHNIETIDPLFLNRLWVWENAELIESDNIDFAKPSNTCTSKIINSKHLKVNMPIYSEHCVKTFFGSKYEDFHLDIITTPPIFDLIKKSDLGDEFLQRIKNSTIDLYLTNDINEMCLICADNFIAMYLFFNNHQYDSTKMLLSTDKDAINELNVLYDIFLNLKF